MEPKFQSSFIPKGPIGVTSNTTLPQPKEKGIFSFLAKIVFTISVVLAVGVFGYKLYLNYHIKQMGLQIESASSSLASEELSQFTRLDDRLVSTQALIAQHSILTPLFSYLESATLKSVRFSSFNYASGPTGIEVRMGGQARGYSGVALQSDMFNESDNFRNPVFSDLSLDDSGNVVFSFQATVNPSLISYQKQIEKEFGTSVAAPSVSTATTTVSASTTDNLLATSTDTVVGGENSTTTKK